VAVLGWAVIRPWGLPEAVIAVPAAALLAAAAGTAGALAQARRLGPVLGFLADILVLAQLCEDDGLFRAFGGWLGRSAGHPRALLTRVFVVAAATTAVLSLDATVVLLTPVVFATVARLGMRAKPHVYACTHLANSGSLLLPVANLTNLLAFAATGLAFTRFAGLMALPWLAALGVEYAVFRRFFAADRADLPPAPDAGLPRGPGGPAGGSADGPAGGSADGPAGGSADGPAGGSRVPVFTLVVLAATLAGFAVTSAAGVNPAWAALAGAAVLGGRALARRRATPLHLARAADLPFLVFVLALGIIVSAVVSHGLASAIGSLVPAGTSLPSLLAVAALAAVLANVVNNLPATLMLLPLAAASGPGAVLAMLIGVNIGPNLTYTGSLATLLWRRVLRDHESGPALREFTTLGLLTVPAGLVLAVLALWGMLHVIGG
jgi:arsenical pump membrane protein